MPQMSPLLWMPITTSLTLLFITISLSMYFSVFKINQISEPTTLKYQKLNLQWMW